MICPNGLPSEDVHSIHPGMFTCAQSVTFWARSVSFRAGRCGTYPTRPIRRSTTCHLLYFMIHDTRVQWSPPQPVN